MASRGYIPDRDELIVEIKRLAAKHHNGKRAPTKNAWNNRKPSKWATAERIAIAYKADPHDAPNWDNTVMLLTGLQTAVAAQMTREAVIEIEVIEQRVEDRTYLFDGLQVSDNPKFIYQTRFGTHYLVK